jgi:di/tricarboxylate transporter
MLKEYVVFAILIITLALFINGRWRYDIVALISLALVSITGSIPFSHVFSGFSSPAVITVAAVMVITKAINRSGVINYAVDRLVPAAERGVLLHIAMLSIIAAILSAFMNNIGALGLIMPIAIQTSYRTSRSPALLLMPIAFASILGGMTTLIGTPPNLLVSSFRQEYVGQPFEMFAFAPVGGAVALFGVIFIIFLGWRFIPNARLKKKAEEDIFQIKDYVTEVIISEESPLIDKCIGDIEDFAKGDFVFLGLIRGRSKRLSPADTEKLKAKDILLVEAQPKDLEILLANAKLQLVSEKEKLSVSLSSDDVGLVEAVVVPGSKVEGRSTKKMRLHQRYHLNLLGIAREGKPFRDRLKDVKLLAGDVLLLQGRADNLIETIAEIGFLPLAERGMRIGLERSFILPLVIFAVALAIATIGIVPVQIAFSGAVLAMILLNVVPIRQVYDSIDWSIIVLLGAMIPVGEALEITGGTHLLAGTLAAMSMHVSPYIILGLVLVVTMSLSDIMNNAATAVVMAPLAASLGKSLGYSVDPFLMAVAVGASCAFLTPIGHQNNTLIMGPGGYHFSDYWRMGLPLEVLILIISVPLITIVWPL